MIATGTSAAAVRVLSLSVSATEATTQMPSQPDKPIVDLPLAIVVAPCISADQRSRRDSLNAAVPEVLGADTGQLRVIAWYDNEWGFSARVIEMAQR